MAERKKLSEVIIVKSEDFIEVRQDSNVSVSRQTANPVILCGKRDAGCIMSFRNLGPSSSFNFD